jgi:RNA polymerase sigma factor (sigma-70 family)
MMFTNEFEVKCGSAKQSDAERMNALARAVRLGDADSFNELYTLAFSKAKAVAKKKGARGEEVFDIAQTAMIRLYRDIAKVDYVSTWVTTVVSRLVIDMSRKKSYSCEVYELDAHRGDDDDSCPIDNSKVVVDSQVAVNPEASLFREAEREAVMEVLSLLPVQQRKALYLSFVEQKKQDEIAGLLGISRSTVAAHIRTGKANFRREIAARYDVSLFGIETAYELKAA